eukprot:scaffold38769_cov35-Tisochrysis_lutea.AAC.1
MLKRVSLRGSASLGGRGKHRLRVALPLTATTMKVTTMVRAKDDSERQKYCTHYTLAMWRERDCLIVDTMCKHLRRAPTGTHMMKSEQRKQLKNTPDLQVGGDASYNMPTLGRCTLVEQFLILRKRFMSAVPADAIHRVKADSRNAYTLRSLDEYAGGGTRATNGSRAWWRFPPPPTHASCSGMSKTSATCQIAF